MEEEVQIRNLTKELKSLGFDEDQAEKILEWVDTIPIRIYGGEDIHVKVNKGAVAINSHLIDPYDLSFNLLSKQTRLTYLWDTGHFYNPFKLPKDVVMFNPFTGKAINGDGTPAEIGDKIHYMHNVFNCKLFSRIEYKDNKAVKMWRVNDQNEWQEEELRKE